MLFTLIVLLHLLLLYSYTLVLKSNIATYQIINQTMQWFILCLKTQESIIIQTSQNKTWGQTYE
jgi:hypothetical protein